MKLFLIKTKCVDYSKFEDNEHFFQQLNYKKSLPSHTFMPDRNVRHSIRCDECIFVAIRYHLVDETHHCDTVAPRVLEVNAG